MAKLTILNPMGEPGAGGGRGTMAPMPASAPMPRPDVVPPPPLPRGPAAFGLSLPIPVMIVAPQPLDVRVIGDMPAPAKETTMPPKPKAGEGWGKWMLDLAGTGVNRAGVAAAGAAGGSVMPALRTGRLITSRFVGRDAGSKASPAGSREVINRSILNTAVGGAVAGLSKLGPYGMAAAAGVKVFAETVGAVKETVNGLVQRGRELAPYSGTLAASAARADVRRIQSDVGEAERIGPQLAKLIEAQSKAEAMQQRMLEPIKAVLTEKLTALLERGMEILIQLLDVVNNIVSSDDLEKLIKELKAINADSGDVTDLVEKWARGFGGPMPTPIARPARRAPLGMPIF